MSLLNKHHIYLGILNKINKLHTIQPKMTILDCGCGNCNIAKELPREITYVGIDLKRISNNICNFILGSIIYLPIKNESIDIILAIDVLEHIQDPSLALNEINRTLKKNGLVYISTPNPRSLGAIYKGEKWSALKDKTHCTILSLDEWKKEILKNRNNIILKAGYDFPWDPPYFVKHNILEIFIFEFISLFGAIIGHISNCSYGENIIIYYQKKDNV